MFQIKGFFLAVEKSIESLQSVNQRRQKMNVSCDLSSKMQKNWQKEEVANLFLFCKSWHLFLVQRLSLSLIFPLFIWHLQLLIHLSSDINQIIFLFLTIKATVLLEDKDLPGVIQAPWQKKCENILRTFFLIDSIETDISIVALLLRPKYFIYDWSVLHMSSEWFNFSFLLPEPYFRRRKKIFIGICLFRRLTQKKLFELTWILASVSPIFIASSSLK